MTDTPQYEKPEHKKIEYVIDYAPTAKQSLSDSLSNFTLTYLRRVPRASVFISPERETSLLEALANIPGITYRRGAPRRAFDEDVHK